MKDAQRFAIITRRHAILMADALLTFIVHILLMIGFAILVTACVLVAPIRYFYRLCRSAWRTRTVATL